MRPASHPVRDQRGFTLVELMVGVLILVVGLLAVAGMVAFANRTASASNARVGATNLGREVMESLRSIDYKLLTPAQLATELHKRPNLPGTGLEFPLERRGVTYTVRVDVCTYDHPRDGLAPVGKTAANPCNTNGTGAADSPETNPDDFRRVTLTMSWARGGTAAPESVTHQAMIVNPSGSLGPRIKSLYEPPGQVGTHQPYTSTGAPAYIDFPVTTDEAAAVHFQIGRLRADASPNPGPTDWTYRWNLGTNPLASDWVVDGVYTVAAQAFDSTNSPGDTRFATVLLNRNAPMPVAALQGGRNQRFGIVDLRWTPSIERDIREYRVYRITSTGKGLLCTVKVDAPLHCFDPKPPAGTQRYEVVAVDLAQLDSATSALSEGAPQRIDVPETAGTAPDAPSAITATLEEGLPTFRWTQTGTEAPIFYRVYRVDGTSQAAPTLADRYAVTFTADPIYRDPTPASGPVTYWISAVGASFNESLPSAAITWTP